MIKRVLFKVPWGIFIVLTSVFLELGLVFALFSLGFYISEMLGVLGIVFGVLVGTIFIPFCWLLGNEVDNYLEAKSHEANG